jgi:hypothetical protein
MMNLHLSYAPPYPSHVFTGDLGNILHTFTQGGLPPEIAGTELIAFVSLLTQGVADITWPNGAKSSIGANCLLVAPSGSGKTLVYTTLMQPIETYIADCYEEKGLNENFEFLLEDVTREAIVKSLSDWPVAGLFTDEAGQLKSLLKDAATLVKLIDGTPLRSARVSTGRVALMGHRLTTLLMEQPTVFESTKVQLGAKAGGVGLINRFFPVSCVGATSGVSLHQVALSPSVKLAYDHKVKTLLDATINHVTAQVRDRPALRLSAEAIQFLNYEGDEVQRVRAQRGTSFCVSEYMLRHVERVLRLAGSLHVFEQSIGKEVALETVQRAAILGRFHIDAYTRMIYTPPQPTQVELDAIVLERALQHYLQNSRTSQIRQSEVRSYAINLGLTTSRFSRALALLGGQQRICVRMHRNTPWVELIRASYAHLLT